MKRIFALVLVGIMILSVTNVFAEEQSGNLPDIFKVVKERYTASIEEAIKNSKFDEEQIDKDNIYIVEKKNTLIFDGGTDNSQYYVALPALETEDIRFASFYNGEYQSEGMNTLSWLDKVETHKNTKIEEYIKSNELDNVTEIISTIFSVSSGTNIGRATINAYKVVTTNDTYYIPYYVSGVFNPANDETCSLELCKAYTKEKFATLTKTETQSYLEYKEAEKKAEEENHRPTVSLDENGDEVIKVNGINLNDVKKDILKDVDLMEENSYVEIIIDSDEECFESEHRYEASSSKNDLIKFIDGLFEELNLQIVNQTETPVSGNNHCYIKIRYKENGKWVLRNTAIEISDTSISLRTENYEDMMFNVKNSDAILNYLSDSSKTGFNSFKKNFSDKSTPEIRGNIDGLTKTDVIEFEFELPSDCDNDISKEVSSPGKTVKGIFERYKENKYKSTYLLTLSGNLGTISFCEQTQSSLSGEEEIFSNNIPVSFLNTIRYEGGNIVEYKVGKQSIFYNFKMVFNSNDIYEVYFEKTRCTNLKYTQLTEDKKLAEEFVEKDKEAILREARECADTLYDFGLFKGTDKGYELEKSLTREESATILVRLLGEENKVTADDFDEVFVDVDKDRWSYAYVMYCYKNNITKGTGADTFSPDVQIDANQFITLMMRLLGYSDVEPDTALQKSVDYKLLPQEKIDELTMKKVFTRSDMVQIVYNSLKTQMDDETLFADYLLEKGILTEKEIKQIK